MEKIKLIRQKTKTNKNTIQIMTEYETKKKVRKKKCETKKA